MVTQKTNLNISPYFDDFDESKNFVRTLFRPGSAIQARELTQLQSSLQNQIAKHSDHIFEEGAMVIPGQISFNPSYYSLKLVDTFSSLIDDFCSQDLSLLAKLIDLPGLSELELSQQIIDPISLYKSRIYFESF